MGKVTKLVILVISLVVLVPSQTSIPGFLGKLLFEVGKVSDDSLPLGLMMTSTEAIKTSLTITSSISQDYNNPDD